MAEDIFNHSPADNGGGEIDLSFNDLVGEGRKYNNPDELAKGYANAESFLEKLKAENAELRAAKDIEDARLKNQEPPVKEREQVPNRDNGAEPPKQNSSIPDGVDFRSQIKEEIKALNESERAKANLDAAAARMISIYGNEDGASQAISKRANELGVSVDWLKDSAGRSPEAFFATMGITDTQRSTSTPTSTPEVRTDQRGNVKDFEFYDALRKENPKLYFSAATQTEMMAQARKMGSDFYRR